MTRLDECEQALGLTPGADYPEPKLDAAVNDYVAELREVYSNKGPRIVWYDVTNALRLSLGRALQQRDNERRALEEVVERMEDR